MTVAQATITRKNIVGLHGYMKSGDQLKIQESVDSVYSMKQGITLKEPACLRKN